MNLSPPGMNWSPECYRLFGVDPDSFRPSALQMGNLIHPEDKVLWQDALKRTLREGRPNNGCFDRFRAHRGHDPGEYDPLGLYYYDIAPEGFTRHTLDYGPHTRASGAGIYLWIADIDGNGWKDILAPGKEGLHLFTSLGR